MIFSAFRPLFTVSLGMAKLSQATVNSILKQSGHDFFYDYYWVLKQSGHDSEDMISQVNIYVIDIVWVLRDVCVEVKVHGFIKLL